MVTFNVTVGQFITIMFPPFLCFLASDIVYYLDKATRILSVLCQMRARQNMGNRAPAPWEILTWGGSDAHQGQIASLTIVGAGEVVLPR